MKRTLLLVISIFLASFSSVSAASLYMDPSSGVFAAGDTFSVKVRLDPQNECINAVNVKLDYPAEQIRAVDVARGESILSLWPVDPGINVEEGTVEFAGGIPGGYCGRIDGDPGNTNVIAEVIFQVPGFTIGGSDDNSDGKIVFMDGTEVLLNDGRGTPAQLFVQDALYSLTAPSSDGTTDDWFDLIRDDDIRPEAFSIELLREPSVYSGDWFIAFTTQDKQSGIDRYEVYETDIDNEGYVRGKRQPTQASWKEAKSPYRLEDQTLNSIIRVRAIDKAGNERLAGKIPDESLRVLDDNGLDPRILFFGGIGLAVLLILLFVVFLIRRKKKKKANLSHDTINSNEGAVAPEHTEGDQYDNQNQ